MSDGLSGISGVGGGKDRSNNDIESRIRGISNIEELAELLSDERVLRGVKRIVDDEVVDEDITREPEARISSDVAIEQQLAELEQINDQTDLLRNINKGIIEISDRMSVINDNVLDLISAQGTDIGSNIVDISHKTISEPQQEVELTEKTNVRTVAVKVKADPRNDGFLYIGQDDVTVRDGFKMEPGESEVFPVDLQKNILKVISEEPEESYSYISNSV